MTSIGSKQNTGSNEQRVGVQSNRGGAYSHLERTKKRGVHIALPFNLQTLGKRSSLPVAGAGAADGVGTGGCGGGWRVRGAVGGDCRRRLGEKEEEADGFWVR